MPTAWAGARLSRWPCHQHVQSLFSCSGQTERAGGRASGSATRQPAGHARAKAQPWANPPTPTLLPAALTFLHGFPFVSCHKPVSELPSAPIQLLRCSPAAGIHTRSLPAPAAHCQLQGHPTCRGRAITGSDQGNNSQGQMPALEQQLSHGRTPGQPLPWQRGRHPWVGSAGPAAALLLQGCWHWVWVGSVPARHRQLGSLTSILEGSGDTAQPTVTPAPATLPPPSHPIHRSSVPQPWHGGHRAATQPPLFREPWHQPWARNTSPARSPRCCPQQGPATRAE